MPERDILFLHCQDGYTWVLAGGTACCCPESHGNGCSLPVYQCAKCGDYDYGDNEEARAIIAKCELERRDIEEVNP